MTSLPLNQFHQGLGACFAEVNGCEVVDHYGDALAEYQALRHSAGLIDLGFRGRLSVGGADRARFLNGQVTNNVKDLKPGQGCYAALVNARARLEADLYIYCLPEQLLLDYEPGLTGGVVARIEKYIIADDVQLADLARDFGLLSVQGPKASAAMARVGVWTLPEAPLSFTMGAADFGKVCCIRHSRGVAEGFDLLGPTPALAELAAKLQSAVMAEGGCPCGWRALEMVRIEAGRPRFGVDMDETNLAPEAGLDSSAISYNKGCYIGQEIIARLRTYGQVAKALRGLRLPDDLQELPRHGDKLFRGDKESGYITSALKSPALRRNIALGYVRREGNEVGTELTCQCGTGRVPVTIVPLPFTDG